MEDNTTNSALVCCNSNSSYALGGKVMLSSVIIVFIVVVIIVCFHSHARRHHRRTLFHRHLISTTAAATTNNPFQGLDPSILKSLPTFLYSTTANNNNPQLECAVCLSEFQENETIRILTKCNHCFHIDCIDVWFQCHSNCPLCRAPIQVSSTEKPAETVVLVHEQAGSEGTELGSGFFSSSFERAEDQLGRSSSSPRIVLSPLENERKRLELVGVSDVELCVMNRVISLAGLEEMAGSGNSRGGGTVTLKRIWSI